MIGPSLLLVAQLAAAAGPISEAATAPTVLWADPVTAPASTTPATPALAKDPAHEAPGGFTDTAKNVKPIEPVLTALDERMSFAERADAVDRLAQTRSAKYIPVYAVLLEIGELGLKIRATEALGEMPATAATEKLRAVARTEAGLVAEIAFTALGRQQTEYAASVLYRLASDAAVSDWRRGLAIESLRESYPEYWQSRPAPRTYSATGLGLYALAGAELGAATLLAVGSFGVDPDLSMGLGFLSGGAVGLGAGYVIGEDKGWTTVRGYRALSYQTWGYFGGVLAGIPILDGLNELSDGEMSGIQKTRYFTSMGLLGALAGSYIAHQDDAEFPVEKQALADLSAIAAGTLAGGVLWWTPDFKSATPPSTIVLASTLGALAGIRSIAPDLQFDHRDAPLLATSTFAGAWYPAWMNVALGYDDNTDRVVGWTQVGGGVGWFTGLALSHYLEDTARTVVVADLFGAMGGLLGGGVLQAAGRRPADNSAPLAASHISGSLVGFVTGVGLADYVRPTRPEQLLTLGMAGFGAYQGWGFSSVADRELHETRGWSYIGGVAGVAAGLGLAAGFDVGYPVAGALLSGGGLGAWSSVLGANIAGLEGDDYLLATLAGTDGALLLSGAMMGFGMDPSRIGWAGVFGLGGSGLAAAGMAMASSSRRDIEGAALAGTAAGAIAGGVLGTTLTPPDEVTDLGAKTTLRFLSVEPYLTRLDGTPVDKGVNLRFEF